MEFVLNPLFWWPLRPIDVVASAVLMREALDEANTFARLDSITDKMARYEHSSNVDSIEMLTVSLSCRSRHLVTRHVSRFHFVVEDDVDFGERPSLQLGDVEP